MGYAERHNHEKIVKLLKHFGARSQKGTPRGRHLVTPRGESTSSSPHIGALYLTL